MQCGVGAGLVEIRSSISLDRDMLGARRLGKLQGGRGMNLLGGGFGFGCAGEGLWVVGFLLC